nr:hypothetical protein [uncultured bacterium]
MVLDRKLAFIIDDKVGNKRPIIFVDGAFVEIQLFIGQHFFSFLEEQLIWNVAIAVRYHIDDFAIRDYGIFKPSSGFHLCQTF